MEMDLGETFKGEEKFLVIDRRQSLLSLLRRHAEYHLLSYNGLLTFVFRTMSGYRG